jgi:hypothetical protein
MRGFRLDPWLEPIRSGPRVRTLVARVKREWDAFEV